MYVRWKRRAMRKQVHVGRKWAIVKGQRTIVHVKESQPTGDYALSAQLVESHRVDGRPRQKVIKYLGTIREPAVAHVGHRMSFWRTVSAAFKALDLPPEQQHTIELALHARVPFPTMEEIDAHARMWADLTAKVKERM
jgi:hypothetical protein